MSLEWESLDPATVHMLRADDGCWLRGQPVAAHQQLQISLSWATPIRAYSLRKVLTFKKLAVSFSKPLGLHFNSLQGCRTHV